MLASFRFVKDFNKNEDVFKLKTFPKSPDYLFITSNTDTSYKFLNYFEKRYPEITIKCFGNSGHLTPIIDKEAYYKFIYHFITLKSKS